MVPVQYFTKTTISGLCFGLFEEIVFLKLFFRKIRCL